MMLLLMMKVVLVVLMMRMMVVLIGMEMEMQDGDFDFGILPASYVCPSFLIVVMMMKAMVMIQRKSNFGVTPSLNFGLYYGDRSYIY